MSQPTNERYPQRQTRQPFPLIWIFAAAAVLLIAGVGLWWASSHNGAANVGPRIVVDQEKIDFGRVPLDKPVRAEFRITNVGDRTLTLDASAPIQVLEGC